MPWPAPAQHIRACGVPFPVRLAERPRLDRAWLRPEQSSTRRGAGCLDMRAAWLAAFVVGALLAGCSHPAATPASVKLPLHNLKVAPAGDGHGTVLEWDADPTGAGAGGLESWVSYGPPGNPALYSSPHQFGTGHHVLRIDDVPPGWVFQLMGNDGG